jgi:hypothetical protein
MNPLLHHHHGPDQSDDAAGGRGFADSPLDEWALARDPLVPGVALRRIVIWQGCRATTMEMDGCGLRDGFHTFRRDNGFRCTNVDAGLPWALFGGLGGTIDVELQTGCTTHYPLLNETILAAA